MTIVKKFFRINNVESGYITHEDKELYGLKFRVISQFDKSVLLLVKGDYVEVEIYKSRFGIDITEIAKIDVELQYTMDDRKNKRIKVIKDMVDSTIDFNTVDTLLD